MKVRKYERSCSGTLKDLVGMRNRRVGDFGGGPAWDCFSEEALLRKPALDIHGFVGLVEAIQYIVFIWKLVCFILADVIITADGEDE